MSTSKPGEIYIRMAGIGVNALIVVLSYSFVKCYCWRKQYTGSLYYFLHWIYNYLNNFSAKK